MKTTESDPATPRSMRSRLLRPASLLAAAVGYAAFGLFLMSH
jgi:hypothetical protein